MKKAKRIHFVGIKGVGMTALAALVSQAGIHVTGSDTGEKFITDEAIGRLGIPWKVGFSPKNLEGQPALTRRGRPDLVIVTGAHGGMTNPEARWARERGFETVMQGKAVGLFMSGQFLGREDFEGISVSGSHGKTTTAAMMAAVLTKRGLDPTYAIGCGGILPLGFPGHFGRGKYFIAEADEYATCPETDKTPKFLWQNPKILVITNIEYDHPDIFKDITEVAEAFKKFTENLPRDGLLVAGKDNHHVSNLLKMVRSPVITFGEGPQNDWRLKKIISKGGKIRFWVDYKGKDLGNFELSVPGKFNALNALGTIVVGLELGIPSLKIKEALSEFGGTKRRFEFIAEVGGVKLYDDYAHHPTEISSTLAAAKDFFPGQKIICLFQPHTYSRTKMLLKDFARCFSSATEVLIADIYSSAREKSDFGINSKILTEEIAKYHPRAKYIGKKENAALYLSKNAPEDTVIFTMGAGDIFLWHSEILSVLKERAK